MVTIFHYLSSLNLMQPDICAPGVEICVPFVKSTKNDEYMISSGTSLACPHVAGIAALIKREFQKNSLIATPAMIMSAIMTTGKEFINFFFPSIFLRYNYLMLRYFAMFQLIILKRERIFLLKEQDF